MSLYDRTPKHATFVNDLAMNNLYDDLIKILTADKGQSYTIDLRYTRLREGYIKEYKRLLKSRASEYSFEIHNDGYLLITRL